MIIMETEMYWLTRLDYIQSFLFIFGLIGFLLMFAMAVTLMINKSETYEEDEAKKYNPYIKLSILALVVSLILLISSLFVPTTKEIYAIKLIPVVVNNEKVQKLHGLELRSYNVIIVE